jgi:hypothetical protein
MRASFLVLMVAAALLAMSGCVQFHSDVAIDGKGGGTATVKMSVATDVLKARADMMSMGGAMGMDLPDYDTVTRAYLEKRAAGHGVTINTFDKGEAAGRKTLACTLSFTDLKGISWVLNDVSGALGGAGLGVAKTPDGNFVLRTKQYNFPATPAKTTPPPAPTPEQMQRQSELAATLMGAINELDIVVKLTVPGDVVRSNAPKVEGRTSIWTINAANMMAQQEVAPEIVFSSKGLALPTAAK